MIWHIIIIVALGKIADYFDLMTIYDFCVLGMLGAIYNAIWNLYKSVTWVEIKKEED